MSLSPAHISSTGHVSAVYPLRHLMAASPGHNQRFYSMRPLRMISQHTYRMHDHGTAPKWPLQATPGLFGDTLALISCVAVKVLHL